VHREMRSRQTLKAGIGMALRSKNTSNRPTSSPPSTRLACLAQAPSGDLFGLPATPLSLTDHRAAIRHARNVATAEKTNMRHPVSQPESKVKPRQPKLARIGSTFAPICGHRHTPLLTHPASRYPCHSTSHRGNATFPFESLAPLTNEPFLHHHYHAPHVLVSSHHLYT
jgi:hypothetical protein